MVMRLLFSVTLANLFSSLILTSLAFFFSIVCRGRGETEQRLGEQFVRYIGLIGRAIS